MTICPICLGKCDASQIQLKEVSCDLGDHFYCNKCKSFFMLNQIDEEYEPEIVQSIKDALLGDSA